MPACVFIGEGKGEKIFLEKLLEAQFNFKASSQKSPILFIKKEIYWLFPFPHLGVKHSGGAKNLKRKDTYKDCKSVVHSFNHILPYDNIHYLILRDVDKCTDLSEETRKIKSATEGHLVKPASCDVLYCKKELESWFIGGLSTKFPYVDSKVKYKDLMACHPEKLEDPKEELNKMLPESMRGNMTEIANAFGEFIDISKASNRCPSLKKFIATVSGYKLL